MLEHFYTKEEIQEIKYNFHKTLEFKKQFETLEIDEEEAIRNFLKGDFKIGSITDPLLNCLGEAINKYKFKQTPKRINTMNTTINNLPHIMDAELVAQPSNNAVTHQGKFCNISYSVKPSAKKPGKAIVSVNIAYGEEEIAFKYSTKIENVSEEIINPYFTKLTKLCDVLFNFNVSLEETEDSSKGVFNVKFEARQVETYGQYFEIEPVEAEINFSKYETIFNFVQDVLNNVSEYRGMLNKLEAGNSRVITIDKGKNSIEYISNENPEVCGNLLCLNGNITSEEIYVSSLDAKSVSSHLLTEEDIEEMGSVIFSDLEANETEETEVDENLAEDEVKTDVDVETETEGL